MAEFIGTDDVDFLIGEDGGDTLKGGLSGDVLEGGAGADLFVIDEGDSLQEDGLFDVEAIDVVVDFEPQDRILFTGAEAPVFGALYPGVADTYEDAYDLAAEAADKGFEYASIKVGSDVFVFALRVNSVVKLQGVDPSIVTNATFSAGAADTGMIERGGPDGEARAFAAGSDLYDGAGGDDTIEGGAGSDTLNGGDGDDRVFAGLDDDQLDGGAGANYLRGEEGDDVVNGGDDHDDINGNMGADTLYAGAGDDWVRGGKDDDIVFAGEGDDLAFGDLGNDTVGGGAGGDSISGGAGDDMLRGDDGDDTIAGEAGMDTMDGGIGADVFVFGGEEGVDKVMWFNAGEGDQVLIADGLDVTITQEGDDVVISAADGGQMILAGVNLASLPQNWLVGG